jgi:hexosaminidase
MALTFTAAIVGGNMHCEIGTDRDLKEPVLCFSLMAAAAVVSGGTLIRRVAGYSEVALPNIAAGVKHDVIIRYEDASFGPRNRAWLPMGAYLRVGRECLPLPAGTDLGVRPGISPGAVPKESDEIPLVPPPKSWLRGQGHLAFRHAAPHDAVTHVDELAKRLNLGALMHEGGTPVSLAIDSAIGGEAYRLTVTADGIGIAAGTDHGFHNACITLLNLRETTGGRLPCGVISDEPRFGWRGQHLDCARHNYSVETILRLLDIMALVKLNRFHWHFADDEAFRLEVSCLPGLWRRTAFRGEGELVPGVFGGGIRSGGTYSKADVARVVAHAAKLHIEVLPEIEVPAHSFALNKAIPGMRDAADNGAEASIQGYLDNIINPAMAATWEILPLLIDEVCGMFPLGMLHLGCDELPPGAWSGSPAVTKLKKAHGLQTPDDVQGWMMAQLAKHLTDKGVRPAAWEEAAKGNKGGIGHNAVLFSWTGQDAVLEAARRGHEVVMCPAQNTYLDHAHTGDPDDWGAAWAGVLPLEKTVDWDPVPQGYNDVAARIIGVQSCFWSEFTTDDSQIEAMIAPRILGIACKGWEADRMTDGARLRRHALSYTALFKKANWRTWNR